MISFVKNNEIRIKAFVFGIVIALAAALISPSRVNADQQAVPAAGSAEDPLITLSYLNSVLESVKNLPEPEKLEVVELKKGQRLRANSAALEIILRPGGAALVISPHSDQGIADLTWGTELLQNDRLPVNHLLLIPRADGRGISVSSDVAYVIIRGGYEIY